MNLNWYKWRPTSISGTNTYCTIRLDSECWVFIRIGSKLNSSRMITCVFVLNSRLNKRSTIHLTSTFYPTLGDRVHHTACILNSVTIPSSSFVWSNYFRTVFMYDFQTTNRKKWTVYWTGQSFDLTR